MVCGHNYDVWSENEFLMIPKIIFWTWNQADHFDIDFCHRVQRNYDRQFIGVLEVTERNVLQIEKSIPFWMDIISIQDSAHFLAKWLEDDDWWRANEIYFRVSDILIFCPTSWCNSGFCVGISDPKCPNNFSSEFLFQLNIFYFETMC